MLDIRLVREQLDVVREGMRRRGKLGELAPALDRLEGLERERREMIQAVEERKARRNAITQDVAKRKRAKENADDLIAQGRELGDEIGKLESERALAEAQLERLLLDLPNITRPEVPAGGEECNTVVRSWGTPRPAGDDVRPHWEIGERLGILDLPRGAKITGSGFPVFRAGGARLVRALMSFLLDLHVREHGYEEVCPPFVVNRATMTGTAQLPKFEEDMYAVRDDDLFLIPTAEVPVTNLYRDEILDPGMLPKGFVAFTPCFRREAGAAGKDTRGILRVHQFDKVELVRYASQESSTNELEVLTSHAEKALQLLGLAYRVVLLAAGDTGFASAKTYDLEVWAPGVGKFLECSSCSVCDDFQARRANIRYRPAAGEKPRLVHTLNGSALAFPRTIAALLETYQNADGSVTIPEPLRPYLGTDRLG